LKTRVQVSIAFKKKGEKERQKTTRSHSREAFLKVESVQGKPARRKKKKEIRLRKKKKKIMKRTEVDRTQGSARGGAKKQNKKGKEEKKTTQKTKHQKKKCGWVLREGRQVEKKQI